jgi:hypothetical protein
VSHPIPGDIIELGSKMVARVRDTFSGHGTPPLEWPSFAATAEVGVELNPGEPSHERELRYEALHDL